MTDGAVWMGRGLEIKRFGIRDGLGLEIFAAARHPGRLGVPPALPRDAAARGEFEN